ncbi:MAG: AAA family ATPase [Prevotellaceae bacterium]|nr:AAA family ATPase [Candidatus Minthosoma caballi]
MSSQKSNTIIGACIIGFFVASAILTVAVGSQSDDEEKKTGSSGSEYISASRTDSILAAIKRSSDSDGNNVQSDEEETDPYEELNELTGLTDVKKEVVSLANFVKVQQAREKQGLKQSNISLHLVFTGNPGTGKTTVARILARIYKDLGVLKKGHLVETDQAGLIGEYVGQTAPKVNHMVDSAMGGVLFIDEAYALTSNKMGNSSGYGAEAIATLLKRMEDDRGKFVVIVAGYTGEMKEFVESNPGLKSRFTRYLHFPDYSAKELHEIYMMRVKKYGFSMSDETSAYLLSLFEDAVKSRDRNFGNARYARNLFENTITAQANRLSQEGDIQNMSKEQLSAIKKEDIENALKMLKTI